MTEKLAAFGASQPGRTRTTLFDAHGRRLHFAKGANSGKLWLVRSLIWGMSVKMNKLIMIITTVLPAMLLIPNTACAQIKTQWSGRGYGDYVNNSDEAFRFRINSQNTDCGDQFYVSWSELNSKELYALVLTAIASGWVMRANYSCENPKKLNVPYTNNIDVFP